MTIAENVALIRENINRAAEKCGRDGKDIKLLAATKMNDADRVKQAVAAGIDRCGENRVQEMLEKNEQGAYAGCPLHFIGHLQKNKVKYVVGLAELIHGADSVELIAAINKEAKKRGIVQDILLEINIGSEESKSGFRPEEIPSVLASMSEFCSVNVRGLMAIPPMCSSPDENRPYFAQMQQLFIDNSEKKYDNVHMDFLSMGMSDDYTEAIACGANMVRIGSAIFGRRIYK